MYPFSIRLLPILHNWDALISLCSFCRSRLLLVSLSVLRGMRGVAIRLAVLEAGIQVITYEAPKDKMYSLLAALLFFDCLAEVHHRGRQQHLQMADMDHRALDDRRPL